MPIRGVGSFGAPAPNMDPKTQAQVDVAAMQHLVDDLHKALEEGNMPLAQQLANTLANVAKDLQNNSSTFPQNIQDLINDIATKATNISQKLETVSLSYLDVFHGELDVVGKYLNK